MDAAHYERIADCLMQFRGKLPKFKHLGDDNAIKEVKAMHLAIDILLMEIDEYAKIDSMGWIK
jgi:hypothetical protein